MPSVLKFGSARFNAATELCRFHSRPVDPSAWSVLANSRAGAWKMCTCSSGRDVMTPVLETLWLATRFSPW